MVCRGVNNAHASIADYTRRFATYVVVSRVSHNCQYVVLREAFPAMMGSWWPKGARLQGSHTRATETKQAGIRRPHIENSVIEFSEGGSLMTENRRKDRHSSGYARRFDKETYDHINFAFRKDSGIMDALELACRKTGMAKNEYIREALLDRLVADDCMPWK